MARGPWKRDPVTGLPVSIMADSDIDSPDLLRLYPGFVHCVASAAAIAHRTERHFTKMMTDPSSRFHFVQTPICAANGAVRVIIYSTDPSSVVAAMLKRRARRK